MHHMAKPRIGAEQEPSQRSGAQQKAVASPGDDGPSSVDQSMLPPAFPEVAHFGRLLRQSDDPLALSAMLAVRRAASAMLGLNLRSR